MTEMDLLGRFFGKSAGGDASDSNSRGPYDVHVATCALVVEMANIDSEFSATETKQIVAFLQREYDLAAEDAAELTRLAKEQLTGSVDLWRFTNLINQNYSFEEKMRVAELMWKVVYEDGHMSAHEHYLMNKLGRMLRLSHRDLIRAKLAVLESHEDGG